MKVAELARLLRERWGFEDSLLTDLEMVQAGTACEVCHNEQIESLDELLEVVRLATTVQEFFDLVDARGCGGLQ